MRLEPALPRPSSISPSRRTTVGAIIEGTRRPGAIAWKPSGLRSSSPSMLLRMTPVPGTSTPEPEPFEQVTLAHIPLGVEDRDVGGRAEQVGGREVEAGRIEEARRQLLPVEGLGELLAAAAVGGAHRGDQLLGAAALAEPLQQAEAEGDQDPARGGRRVGQDLGAAEGGPDRRAARSPHRWRGRPGPSVPPPRDRELAQRRRHLAAVERLGPLGAEALQRLGQLREAKHLALAQRPPRRRVELARPRQALVDRREDVEDVGLLGVDRGALAGEPDRRGRPAPPAAPSRSAPAPAPARRRVPGTPQEAGPT